MRQSCGDEFPSGLMLRRKKLAKRQKKLVCGEKKKTDLLLIDVVGKRGRTTWLFDDACWTVLRQGWGRLGGICGSLPVPWGKPDGPGACRCGFWLGSVPCLGIVSRSLRFQGRSGSAGGSVVQARLRVPTPVGRVQKHIGGVG